MENAARQTPVLIAGGGPVGLALALDLGRRGVRSVLVERDAETGSELLAKAGFLNERTMEYCRTLGILDDIIDIGFPENASRDTVYCTSLNGHFIGRYAMPSLAKRTAPPEAREMHRRCPQFQFDPLLARAVMRQGMCEILYGYEFESFEQDDAGVTCWLRRIEDDARIEYRADYLAACDGAGSAIRKALGIAFEGEHLDYSVSVMIRAPRLEDYHPFGLGERYMFISPEGTWANLTSVDSQDLYRFTVVGSEAELGPDSIDMDALLKRAFGRDDVPYEMMRVMPWRRSQFTAESYAKGRVFLAGDAAHTTSPTGGHGLNTGIGDAWDLAWILQALIEGWGGPGLAEAYTAERRPVAIRNGSSSSKNYKVWVDKSGREKVLDDGPEGDAQRKALGEKMSARLAEEWSSFGIAMGYDYSASPLVAPDGTPAPEDHPSVYIPTARPGHRAPHHWLADGSSVIDLFGAGFVLLRLGNAPPDGEPLLTAARAKGVPVRSETIADPEVAELYEAALVLVRPDGMVAWRGDELPADCDALVDRVRGASASRDGHINKSKENLHAD